MEREKIQTIVKELDSYIISGNALQPYLGIYGEDTTGSGRDCCRGLSMNSDGDVKEIVKVLSNFTQNIKKYVHREINVADLNKDDKDYSFLYKQMVDSDLEKTEELISHFCKDVKITDFLKNNKFKNVFLFIEIILNQSPEKKIILFKSVGQNYQGKKTNWVLSKLFSDNQKIKFVDNQRDLILDSNFEITAFISKSEKGELLDESFFFIENRKKFENLYGYLQKYEHAYATVTKNMDFIDWTKANPSLALKRKCYSIANYDDLSECIQHLKHDLTSTEDNLMKQALKKKGIKYEDDNGNIKILPENTRELSALLKIITDGLATTYLLGKSVLGSDFEILN